MVAALDRDCICLMNQEKQTWYKSILKKKILD